MELEGAKERLKLVRADLMEECSFDDAVMGCEGVFHTANPVPFGLISDHKAELVDPAVNGTLNVLRSCKKNPMIKKVVLTSSVAAVARPASFPKEPVILDEGVDLQPLPFVWSGITSIAQQVYYSEDPRNPNWSVVCRWTPREGYAMYEMRPCEDEGEHIDDEPEELRQLEPTISNQCVSSVQCEVEWIRHIDDEETIVTDADIEQAIKDSKERRKKKGKQSKQ